MFVYGAIQQIDKLLVKVRTGTEEKKCIPAEKEQVP